MTLSRYLAAALPWFAVVACAEPVTLPAPTGTFGVGETMVRLVDDDGLEPLTEATPDHREAVVHLWYPADPAPDLRPSRSWSSRTATT